RTTVSKINIPISPPENPAGCLNHRNEGSLLDADHPANGVLFARRSTLKHKRIETTLRYAHVLDDDVRNALEASEQKAIPPKRQMKARRRR
ncbi:MAG: hypothetical protein ACO1OX_15120, partial [Novosphingobium sp.]